MVTRAFNHRGGARQAHGEAFTGHAAEVRLTGGGTVHHRVAHDGVARRFTTEVEAGAYNDAAARQTLAGVVVRVTNQVQRDALGQERAE